MLISNIIVSFAYPTTLVMVLKERMDLSLISKSIFVFSIIGGIFGMKYFGLLGVVTATVIGDFLRNLLIYYFLNKSFKLPYNFKGYWNYVIVFFTITITFYFMAQGINSIFDLILYSLFFALVYFLFNIYFNALNSEDIIFIRKISNHSKPLQKVDKFIQKILIIKSK